jgi:hypothetical protein
MGATTAETIYETDCRDFLTDFGASSFGDTAGGGFDGEMTANGQGSHTHQATVYGPVREDTQFTLIFHYMPYGKQQLCSDPVAAETMECQPCRAMTRFVCKTPPPPQPPPVVTVPTFASTPQITTVDTQSVCEQVTLHIHLDAPSGAGYQSNSGLFDMAVYDGGVFLLTVSVAFNNGEASAQITGFTAGASHVFSVELTNPETGAKSMRSPDAVRCSVRSCTQPPNDGGFIVGDPQFVGLRGQSYQVHGVSGEIYNIVSDADLQYNSRFVFLNSGACPVVDGRKQKGCFSHPGSYLGELGLKTRSGDKIHLTTGAAKDGFAAVEVNGKALEVGETVLLADNLGSVSMNSTHLASVQVGNWDFAFENSDMFVNQRVRVLDARGLRSHGLLGQTWRETTYPNAIKYIQGQVDDYVIRDNDIFGDNFVFNTFN